MIRETKSLKVRAVLTLFLIVLLSTGVAQSKDRESAFAAQPRKDLPNESLRYPRIRPLRTTVHFPEDSSAKRWNAVIFCTHGKPAYTMSLVREYGPERATVGVDLVLRQPGAASDSNLFNPHNWHGLQPWIFAGRDLAGGAYSSTYGAHRELKLSDEHLLIKIDVGQVNTRALADGQYQLTHIVLAISVQNLG